MKKTTMKGIAMLLPDFTIFDPRFAKSAGVHACRDGLLLSDNPYVQSVKPDAFAAWAEGFVSESEAKTAVKKEGG